MLEADQALHTSIVIYSRLIDLSGFILPKETKFPIEMKVKSINNEGLTREILLKSCGILF